MKGILKKFLICDTGAVQVIEMTLIFPFVLGVMAFLLYFGSYVMQSVSIYNDAQRIAVAASREGAMPGYLELYGATGVTTQADFNWPDGTVPARTLIDSMMNEHKPYRFWTDNFIDTSDKLSLETNLENLVASNSLLVSSDVDCVITTNNNFLSQEVKVNVVKRISTPQFLKFLGMTDTISIDVTATAVAGNPVEFIRNTDIVFDLTEYMFNNLKIGKSGQTANEKIAIYKQKFKDMCSSLGMVLE